MHYCPKCGALLEEIGEDPAVRCGGILYYQCTGCKACFKQDESGILATKPFNLEEVPSALAERYRRKNI